jgi:hypothetical protein
MFSCKSLQLHKLSTVWIISLMAYNILAHFCMSRFCPLSNTSSSMKLWASKGLRASPFPKHPWYNSLHASSASPSQVAQSLWNASLFRAGKRLLYPYSQIWHWIIRGEKGDPVGRGKERSLPQSDTTIAHWLSGCEGPCSSVLQHQQLYKTQSGLYRFFSSKMLQGVGKIVTRSIFISWGSFERKKTNLEYEVQLIKMHRCGGHYRNQESPAQERSI